MRVEIRSMVKGFGDFKTVDEDRLEDEVAWAIANLSATEIAIRVEGAETWQRVA